MPVCTDKEGADAAGAGPGDVVGAETFGAVPPPKMRRPLKEKFVSLVVNYIVGLESLINRPQVQTSRQQDRAKGRTKRSKRVDLNSLNDCEPQQLTEVFETVLRLTHQDPK